MTSPLDSIPAEISPRLPVARPTPSFRATNRPAATIETTVVRRGVELRSSSGWAIPRD